MSDIETLEREEKSAKQKYEIAVSLVNIVGGLCFICFIYYTVKKGINSSKIKEYRDMFPRPENYPYPWQAIDQNERIGTFVQPFSVFFTFLLLIVGNLIIKYVVKGPWVNKKEEISKLKAQLESDAKKESESNKTVE